MTKYAKRQITKQFEEDDIELDDRSPTIVHSPQSVITASNLNSDDAKVQIKNEKVKYYETRTCIIKERPQIDLYPKFWTD